MSRCECHSAGVGGHFTSGAVASGEVSTLDHKVLDDSVEFAALVTKSFLVIQNKHNKIKQHLEKLKRTISCQYFTFKYHHMNEIRMTYSKCLHGVEVFGLGVQTRMFIPSYKVYNMAHFSLNNQ